MKLTTGGKRICLVMALLGCDGMVDAEEALPRMSWESVDHASGVYHAKDAARLSVRVENRSTAAFTINGSIAFGIRVGDDFKVISVTPVRATEIGAGESAKIPLAVEFAGAGSYEIRWTEAGSTKGTAIESSDGVGLECIFAPRQAAETARDGRWLGMLPKEAANVPGYLPDLIKQTGVGKYLLDERFAFDSATGIALGVGASLRVSSEEVNRLFKETTDAHAELILRVTVPMGSGADERTVEAFRQYIIDGVRRAHGCIGAISIAPENFPADRATFRAFYLAGYAAAKSVDKKILMLGAGSGKITRQLLFSDDAPLAQYVDAVGVNNTSDEPSSAIQLAKLPVWVLPPRSGEGWNLVPPAVGLAEGAAVVAVPSANIDRGVIEHLLGGAVVYQKLHGSSDALPYVATFQGDGFAVAAVAGISAGTPADAQWPQLAATRTVVAPVADDDKPAYANLEVGDDSGAMRVVDAAGAAVDCRQGDTVYVPAGEKVVYVLSSGDAEDLMATLRSATANRLPIVEIEAKGTEDENTIVVRMSNISASDVAGNLRIVAHTDKGTSVLGERRFGALPAGKSVELSLSLNAATAKDSMLIAEITTDASPKTDSMIQRTAVRRQQP